MQAILKHEDGRSKVGNIFRLRIFASAEIIQQLHPCFPLFSAIPKYNPYPILELYAKDSLKGSLSSGESFAVSGNEKTLDLKITSDVDSDYESFQDFYDAELKGKNLCVETLNNNGVLRIFNPVKIKYQYDISPEYSTENTYQLSFEPTKFKDYQLRKIIDTVDVATRYYSGTPLSDCTVILQDYCDKSLFKFGYGTTVNIEDATFLNLGISPIFQAFADGQYYFFAVNKLAPDVYESYYININIPIIIVDDAQSGFSIDGDTSQNDYNGSVDGDITTN